MKSWVDGGLPSLKASMGFFVFGRRLVKGWEIQGLVHRESSHWPLLTRYTF